MYSILKIFLLNLLNDIDNGFILASLLRKYTTEKRKYMAIAFYSALILTLSRTLYVLIEKQISELPGLRFVSGVILLWIAVRMAVSLPESRSIQLKRYLSPLFRIFLMLIATDFAICLDTVIMTAELSHNVLEIALGIFFSVFLVLLFFHRLLQIFTFAPWIQIFIAAFLTQVAVMGISHDPIIENLIQHVRAFFWDEQGITTAKLMDIVALDAAILVMIAGILRRVMKKS